MGIAPFRDASRISRRREPPSRPTRPGLVKGLWHGLIGVLILGQLAAAQAGQLTSHLFTAKDYQGSRDRQYQVYVPDGLSGAAPLVMVLHGCAQTPEEVLRDWGMTAAADRHGFILVVPFVLAEQPATCARETASPWAHLIAGRGLSAHWGTTVISSGDRKPIGWPWVWWSRISLYQGPADLWFLERPAVCLDE